jgi:hypothetical protein
MTDNNKNYIEMPPALSFRIEFANEQQLKEIINSLQIMERQTMNFRAMPGSQALILIDNENDKIVGWQGFNTVYNKNIAEKFSLHLDPKYRAFLLGLALETALYKHLNDLSFEYALLRMDKAATPSLMDYRKKIGFLTEVPKEEMTHEWVNMCHKCELFNKSCIEQTFFKINVSMGLNFGTSRLGILNNFNFPYLITLVKEKTRMTERSQFRAKWAA